jgi:hypothetical protein
MRLLLTAMILGASGFGYLKYQNEGDGGETLASWLAPEQNTVAVPDEQMDSLAEAGDEIYAVAGPEVEDFSQIFRFDLSPNQVMERWNQVSAGLSELNLQGFRVPLVTGIEESDLAGSLTYYYDPRRQMRRITFVGTTGNPRKLVQLLVGRYGFRPLVTKDPRRENYVGGNNGRSYCTITPSEVIDQDAPQTRFGIQLQMER